MSYKQPPFNNYGNNHIHDTEIKQIDKIHDHLDTIFTELTKTVREVGITNQAIKGIENNIQDIKKTLSITISTFEDSLKEHDKRLDKLEQHKAKVETAAIVILAILTLLGSYVVVLPMITT